MTNSTNKKTNMQWGIISGIFLLIMSFYIIITSGDASNSLTSVTSDEPTTPVAATTIIETTSFVATTQVETTTNPNSNKIKKTKKKKRKHKKRALAKKNIDFSQAYPYKIKVNRDKNFAVVYAMSKKEHKYLPYKAFVCSTGSVAGYTPLGTFDMYTKYRWHMMVDGTYAQYCIRIDGPIMLHSIPYFRPSSDALEYWEYNKLGSPASLGCVRFRIADIRWIYKHCDYGTKVTIYSDAKERCPLRLRKIKQLKEDDPNAVWDPSDPSPANPWKSKKKSKKNNN